MWLRDRALTGLASVESWVQFPGTARKKQTNKQTTTVFGLEDSSKERNAFILFGGLGLTPGTVFFLSPSPAPLGVASFPPGYIKSLDSSRERN